MAKSKLTKFRLPPAKILRFNLSGKAVPFLPSETDRDRTIVESVLGCPLRLEHSASELAVLAAVFIEKGMARA
jgi:hypothetical protein